MSSKISPSEFQWPDLLCNSSNFDTKAFKTAIDKDSDAWFKYFVAYHAKIEEFKTFHDAIFHNAQQFHNINTALKNELTTSHEQETWLSIQLKALQSQQTQQQPVRAHKSEKLPDPPVFDGSRDKLNGFLMKLWAKINLNNDQYLTQQEKLWYAMTQVSDKVKNQVLPYCLNNTINLSDLTAFEKLMRTSFEDSDWQGTAETTIHELCQRNQEFSTYLAEFNCHIGYTDWNEAARKAALLTEISTELCGYLIPMDVTNMSLDTLTQTLQNIDSCHWAAQQLNSYAWVITS